MKTIANLSLVTAIVVLIGCKPSESKNENTKSSEPTGKQYLVASEPDDSTPVGEARKGAKDGDAVTLVGHIGGSTKPFVEGIAAFTIVDPKVAYCPPEEGCPTPWDYCCTQNEVKENIATVKIVNERGKTVSEDARQLLGVKELSLVVVQGTAKRDEQGNLSVMAQKVYVKQ